MTNKCNKQCIMVIKHIFTTHSNITTLTLLSSSRTLEAVRTPCFMGKPCLSFPPLIRTTYPCWKRIQQSRCVSLQHNVGLFLDYSNQNARQKSAKRNIYLISVVSDRISLQNHPQTLTAQTVNKSKCKGHLGQYITFSGPWGTSNAAIFQYSTNACWKLADFPLIRLNQQAQVSH